MDICFSPNMPLKRKENTIKLSPHIGLRRQRMDPDFSRLAEIFRSVFDNVLCHCIVSCYEHFCEQNYCYVGHDFLICKLYRVSLLHILLLPFSSQIVQIIQCLTSYVYSYLLFVCVCVVHFSFPNRIQNRGLRCSRIKRRYKYLDTV
jgi:hypothetical protein